MGSIPVYEEASLTEKGIHYLYHIESNELLMINWSDLVNDLKHYILELPEEEQQAGNELVDIVESRKLDKGIFSRFTGLLEKHSVLVELLSKASMLTLLNPDELS